MMHRLLAKAYRQRQGRWKRTGDAGFVPGDPGAGSVASGTLRSFSAVLPLKSFRDRAKGLPDLLPYAALLTPHVVLLKSGALMCCLSYAGKDTESSTAGELNAIARISNQVLSGLGSGWVTYHDAVRRETSAYLKGVDHFPDPVSRRIDGQRRAAFEEQGKSFDTYYVLSFVWLPPHVGQQRITDMMYSDEQNGAVKSIADRNLASFETRVENIVDRLSGFLSLRLLGNLDTDPGGDSVTDGVSGSGQTRPHRSELLQYLNYTVSGYDHPIALPETPIYLDALLGAYDYWTGAFPRVDEHQMAVIAVEGFPAQSTPAILESLCDLPLTYRWCNRFLYLDPEEAARELKAYRRKWRQRERGMKDQLLENPGGYIDLDALEMTTDTSEALKGATSATVAYGYYSATVTLLSADRTTLEAHAREVRRRINNLGFVARLESINADSAYLGSIPGNIDFNVRRPFISTRVLSDLVPMTSVWAGHSVAPSPMFPPESPALIQAHARGATPFRLNLHVGDVGHTLILGPTGAGKSTLLSLIQAQARRYQGAQIYCFDKGYSAMALCYGVGGHHYDIGSDDAVIGFCPLRDIDSVGDIAWAAQWVESLLDLQGVAVTPAHRKSVFSALVLLRESPTRTLTEFRANLQDQMLRDAMTPYTIDGPLGTLLDAEDDCLHDSTFSVFEIESLMEMGQASLVPVLLYLFRVIEKRLTGAPSFLVLDEAWVALGHPTFRDKIREWLKTLRKANCAVVMATQQVSDLANSGIGDVVLESCPVKILLPNVEASSVASAPLYQDLLGLNEAQLQLLATAIPKRQYYFLSPEGRRLFELDLDDLALAWCAVSGPEGKARLLKCMRDHGQENWRAAWEKQSESH